LYTGLHSRFDFIQTSHPGIFGEFLPNTAAVIPSVRPSAHPFIKSISPRADCSSHWCVGTGTTSVYSPRNLIRFRAEFVQSISTASLSTTALLTWEGALQKIFSLVFPTCSPPPHLQTNCASFYPSMSHPTSPMPTNRPFLANFLAAFRAQSTYRASAAGAQSSAGASVSRSSSQISSSTRSIATKANTGNSSSTASSYTTTASSQSQSSAASTHLHSHHHSASSRPHSHTRSPLTATSPEAASSATPLSPSSSSPTSTPIPIAYNHDRHRRGSDSSSGSGGFRDALGPEKWYIGGRTAAGEERFYRLGMVTKGDGRLGARGRVGSVDQLSL
jgi:hypothetical protein